MTPRAVHRMMIAAAVVAGAGLFSFNASRAWRFIATEPEPSYRDASEWMGANVPAGETIFHLDWDDFPQLFFFNPQFHYLVGLDPTFMYLTSSTRWKLWSDVVHTNVDDVYTPIRRTFGCRWVFAIPEGEDFLHVARRDPRFFQRYSDPAATVFFLADGYSFVTKWRVTGWYPDPARRLFHAPLSGEPASPPPGLCGVDPPTPGGASPASPVSEAEGRASHGIEVDSIAGFLDLAREVRLPATVEDACAIAETNLDARESETATLAVTTDDEIRVYVNGREEMAHSPFMTPPPGEAGGKAATIDEYLDARSHVPERSVSVRLEKGGNTLTVKDCKVGVDFGYFIRVYREDGSAVAEDRK